MFWPFRRRVSPQPPPRQELDAAAIVRRARRLRFRIRPETVQQLAGAYHGARPGVGLTFAELRAYEPGDDVRHLDWNVTARQGKPFVRRFVEERSFVLWLVVDASASMRFGRESQTKADRAAQSAALLATAAVHNGDRVGLLIVSDRIELELPPAGGIRHLSQIVLAVATPTTSQKTQLYAVLTRIRRTSRRAMMVVLSDFDSEEPVGLWRRASRRHDVVAVRINHPLEERLPDVGMLSIEDSESEGRLVVDAHSARQRRAYARNAEERRQAFIRWCTATAIDGHTMSTETEPLQTLVKLFRTLRLASGQAVNQNPGQAESTQVLVPHGLTSAPSPGSVTTPSPSSCRSCLSRRSSWRCSS